MLRRIPPRYWIVLAVLWASPGVSTAQVPVDRQPSVSQPADANAPAVLTPTPKKKTERPGAPLQNMFPVREPTMGGYIEDASVISQIRVRFDAAMGTDVPDRAEFFYAKCGCYQQDDPPWHDPEAPGPGPGVPTELHYQQYYAYLEYAFRSRVSVFGELPFRAIQPQGWIDFGPDYAPFENQSGLGDIRFGLKASLFDDGRTRATALVRMSAPTGDPAKGMGSNNASIEPGVLFHSRVGARVGLEGQFSYWHLFGGSAGVDSDELFSGDVITYGIGPSVDVFSNDTVRISPMFELVGWHVVDGFETNCDPVTLDCGDYKAGGVDIFNAKIGARFTIRNRHSVYVGTGWALTDDVWYKNVFRLEYRLRF